MEQGREGAKQSQSEVRGGSRRSARASAVRARMRTSARLAQSQLRQEVKAALAVAPEDTSAEQQDLLATHQELVDKILEQKGKYQQEKERRAIRYDDPAVVRQHAARLLRSMTRPGAHVVVYTGAGISTAANIPDYRGPEGLWSRVQRGERAENIVRDLPDLARCIPTYTHMALTRLVALGAVQFIVTQNCDGLHLRAGVPPSRLAEIHGNCFIEVCPRCRKVYRRRFDVTRRSRTRRHTTDRTCAVCPASHPLPPPPPPPPPGLSTSTATTGTRSLSGPVATHNTTSAAPRPPAWPPHLDDTIVHFGEATRYEAVANWRAGIHHADRATCVVVFGSSLKVLKAYACLWRRVRAGKCELFIINNQWTHMDRLAAQKTHADTDAFMRALVAVHDDEGQEGRKEEKAEEAGNAGGGWVVEPAEAGNQNSGVEWSRRDTSEPQEQGRSHGVKAEERGELKAEAQHDLSGSQVNGQQRWAPAVYDEASDPFWRLCDDAVACTEEDRGPGGWLLAGIKGARRK